MWLPSSFFTQQSQHGSGVQKGYQASPPHPGSLVHANPTGSFHTTCSMVETVYAPASAPSPSSPAVRSHPRPFFNLTGTKWSSCQPLWLPSFPFQPMPQGPALLPKPRKIDRLSPCPHSSYIVLCAFFTNVSRGDNFASQGTFIWQ